MVDRDSKKGNSMGLIKGSSALAAWVLFFVSWDSDFSTTENWGSRILVKYPLSFFLLPTFFFDREEEIRKVVDDRF